MVRPDPRRGGPPSGYRYLGLGVQLAASILIFVLLGQWVDRKVGTGGLFTLLGALLGFSATLWSLFRELNRDLKQDDEQKPETRT